MAAAFGAQFQQESELTKVINSLDLLEQVLKRKGLGKLLQNSLIAWEDRLPVIQKLAEILHLPESVEQLLMGLLHHKKVEWLMHILKNLKDLRKKQYNTVAGEITTVKALSPEQTTKVQSIFEKILGSKLLITTCQDADILGGIVVRSGDMLFDASIAKQLQKLTLSIKNS